MRGEGTSNNTIWLPLIKEFLNYVKTNYAFEYNDILDVQRTIDNISAVPKDGLKYFVKCDDEDNEINTTYQFDTEGVELFSYKPVYKDRIIFVDTEREIPNYIFIYRMISNRSFNKLTEPQKEALVVRREEGKKYNNSLLGSQGITDFIGYKPMNLNEAPSVNFYYAEETNVSLYNRRNQANTLKSLSFAMFLVTSNENLYEDENSYTRFFELQNVMADLWGDFLLYCNPAEYKNRVVGILPFNGKIINEVEYQPAITFEMLTKIDYR